MNDARVTRKIEQLSHNFSEPLERWVEDFRARYGMSPIAGGEGTPGAPAVAAPPPPEPAPAAPPPPAPAAPAPEPAPGQPPVAPAEPQAEAPPAWAETLIDRMDRIAPPEEDPILAELGIGPQPPLGQPPAQQPPSQAAPQGQLPQQQAPPALPGQPQPDEMELVQQFIDERAKQIAEQAIQERVQPYFAQQEVSRRRGELESLRGDFPELAQDEAMQQLVTRAQAWSTTLFGSPEAAREPGFLEIVHLANKQLASAAGAPAATPAQPGNGEVPIEQPGGAQPQVAVSQSDQLASGIMAERPGGQLNPLWTGGVAPAAAQ